MRKIVENSLDFFKTFCESHQRNNNGKCVDWSNIKYYISRTETGDSESRAGKERNDENGSIERTTLNLT